MNNPLLAGTGINEPQAQPPGNPLLAGVDLTPRPANPLMAGVMPYKDLITKHALANGIDPQLLSALINQESSFNPSAVSKAGAMGLTQLLPDTARGLGVKNAFDPDQNINGGARYLKQMLDANNGNLANALASYNAGLSRVQKYGGIPPFKETQDYVRNVLSYYRQNSQALGLNSNDASPGAGSGFDNPAPANPGKGGNQDIPGQSQSRSQLQTKAQLIEKQLQQIDKASSQGLNTDPTTIHDLRTQLSNIYQALGLTGTGIDMDADSRAFWRQADAEQAAQLAHPQPRTNLNPTEWLKTRQPGYEIFNPLGLGPGVQEYEAAVSRQRLASGTQLPSDNSGLPVDPINLVNAIERKQQFVPSSTPDGDPVPIKAAIGLVARQFGVDAKKLANPTTQEFAALKSLAHGSPSATPSVGEQLKNQWLKGGISDQAFAAYQQDPDIVNASNSLLADIPRFASTVLSPSQTLSVIGGDIRKPEDREAWEDALRQVGDLAVYMGTGSLINDLGETVASAAKSGLGRRALVDAAEQSIGRIGLQKFGQSAVRAVAEQVAFQGPAIIARADELENQGIPTTQAYGQATSETLKGLTDPLNAAILLGFLAGGHSLSRAHLEPSTEFGSAGRPITSDEILNRINDRIAANPNSQQFADQLPNAQFRTPNQETPVEAPTSPVQTLSSSQGINGGETPKFQTGEAVWKTATHDQPVNVTGLLGEHNGRTYVSIEGSSAGVPLDELTFKEKSQVQGSQSVTPALFMTPDEFVNEHWRRVVQSDLNDTIAAMRQEPSPAKSDMRQLQYQKSYLENALQQDSPPENLANELRNTHAQILSATDSEILDHAVNNPDSPVVTAAAQSLGVSPESIVKVAKSGAGGTGVETGAHEVGNPTTETPGTEVAAKSPEVARPPVIENPQVEGSPRQPEVKEFNPETTSGKNAQIAQDRAMLGLDELPKAEAETIQGWLKEARDTGLVDKTSAIAHDVINNPRQFTDVEQAAVIDRMAYLKNEINLIDDKIHASVEKGEPITSLLNEQKAHISELDNLHQANEIAGSQWGKSGAVRRHTTLLPDRSYAGSIAAYTREAGEPPSPAIQERLRQSARKIAALQEGLEKAQNAQSAGEANAALTEARRSARSADKAALKAERDNLLNQIARLNNRASANPVDLGVEGSKLVGKLALNVIKDGALTLADVVDRVRTLVKDHFPGITDRQIHDALSGYGREPGTLSPMQAKINELKRQATLTSQVADMEAGKEIQKRIANTKPGSPEYESLKAKAADLREQIEIKKKIAAYEAHSPIKRPESTKVDSPQVAKLKDDLLRARLQHDQWIASQKPRTWMDQLITGQRTALLSGTGVLGKLAAATVSHSFISPFEETLGAGIGKLTGLDKLTAEGRGSGRAEIAAVKEFFKLATYEDAWKKLVTGVNSMDARYHEIDPKALDRIRGFFENLHGAVKTPLQRATFAREAIKATDFYASKGLDVTSPDVVKQIIADSYNASKRGILMNDNAITNLWQAATQGIAHMGKEGSNARATGEFASKAMKLANPIVKVPTNFALRGGEYIAGIPYGLAKHITATIRGNMTPEIAGQIMRAYKRGGVGAGLVAIGYFQPQLLGIKAGGYYAPGQRQDKNGPGFGQIQVAGYNLPRWASHVPFLEALQFGATLRQAFNPPQHVGRGTGIKSWQKANQANQADAGPIAAFGRATYRTALGAAEELPLTSNALEMAKSLGSENAFGRAAAQEVSTFNPQLIKEIARWRDSVERSPKGFRQELMMGVPPGVPVIGRQNVPPKTQSNTMQAVKLARQLVHAK